MRKLVILFSLLVLSGFVFGDVFITELADPHTGGGARFVELYNNGVAAVDLSTGYDLLRWTNANTSPQTTAKELTGSIPAGGFYVICANQSTFTSTYGFAADQDIGTGGPADSNGDDKIALRDASDNIIDIFGTIGSDCNNDNTAENFEDGRAERVATVTASNATWTASEWNTDNDQGFGSGPQSAPADFDPGSWIGASVGSDTSIQFSTSSASASEGVGTYDLTVIILNEDATNATTCDVVLTVGDAADVDSYITEGVTFPAGSTTPETVTVTVTDDGTYEGDETLTFTIMNVAGGLNADVGTIDELDFTIEDNDAATTTIPYSETFDADFGDCYTYSVLGATKEWYQTSGYAACNGYGSTETEEDWLVLPGIDFDSYTGEGMEFETYYQYGTDDANNYLKLFYSADYAGVGDPTGSTWTEIAFTYPGSSGILDLSVISGSSVYLAFKYHYEVGNYRSWRVDNISIVEGAGPNITTIVNTPANPGTAQTVSVSADITDPDGIGSAAVHWGTATGVLPNTIAMSNSVGDTYVTDTDIPAQIEGTTVYYEVYAVDNSTYDNTSSENSYLVTDAIQPDVGDIFISEVCDNKSGADYHTAYLEITNTLATPVNMQGSYIERWNSAEDTYEGYTYTFSSGVLIPANGYLIVARGIDQATFETAWGVDLASLNTAFDAGNNLLYFTTGRSYRLYSPAARAELDTTPSVATDDRIAKTGHEEPWSEPGGNPAEGTPGEEEDAPLPVTLSSFTAVYANGASTLQWTTQSESNNLGWNVYRSETENVEDYEQINSDVIDGAGTTTETTDYTFTDENDTTPNTSFWYWIESVDLGGTTDLHGPVQIDIPDSGDETAPEILSINGVQNYPNPFNPSTVMAYKVNDVTDAQIVIYNTKGQIVRTFTDLTIDEDGNGSKTWDGKDSDGEVVSSGIYFYKLTAGSETYTSKMVMTK